MPCDRKMIQVASETSHGAGRRRNAGRARRGSEKSEDDPADGEKKCVKACKSTEKYGRLWALTCGMIRSAERDGKYLKRIRTDQGLSYGIRPAVCGMI